MTGENTEQHGQLKVALTIAGSDSGGGAGIQADLKTFSALGVFGMSAVTCVTAQNPSEVRGIVPLPPEFVVQQIKAVCDSFPVAAAKTGMLYNAEIIRAVADEDVREGIPILVVDPVMVASSGARLLKADAIEALCTELLKQARVVTPNLHEAEILCGHSISSVAELSAAAREIGNQYDVACVVKGGHLAGDEVIDVLFDEGEEYVFTAPRVPAVETHGAGCAFSAAVTALLARGTLLSDAVTKAKEYVHRALEIAPSVGHHRPLNFFKAAEVVPPAPDS
ncbi:MAG: bifunctional hydroxymethylpyrimidine kinase/phosphomethylpyrimidine kinase [Kiritimatiellae bacterium]|nr:bifunctional hydroxymethylpyrimidine kinase/phosphomethylpyrimidine kinase [Kiritimatiellia bacterium]